MKTTTQAFIDKLRMDGKGAGDVVRFTGVPHFIYEMGETFVTLMSMDERKMFITLWG